MLKTARVSPKVWLAAAFAAGVAAAAPAVAQPQTTVEELTVTGRYGAPENVRTLSARVGYGDLDLTTEAGRTALRERVKSTAEDLCRRLGENDQGATALVPTCERDAMGSADEQQRVAIANAVPRGLAAAPAPAPYVAPVGEAAPAATTEGKPASFTTATVTNGPVPDTAENRRAYGQPMSRAGRRSAPAGN